MEKILSTFAVAAAAAAFAAPNVAYADTYQAPLTNSRGRVIILDPLSFIKVDDLHFGTYLIPPSGSGTVTLNPVDNSLSMGGTVTPMPQSIPQRGRLTGSGTPLTPVIVTVALPTKLYVDGDTSKPSIDVTLTLDQPKTVPGFYVYTIGADKTFDVYVGGNLTIAAGQSPGLYSNEYVITATYL